jgi:L-serine/L-threonine ammonia-lyase
MVSKLRTAGAVEVIQVGATWREADKHLREEVLSKDKGGVYVPPFDAEEIFEASAGIIDEVERQLGVAEGKEGKVAADAVVCAVGGGGLFSGLARGIERSSIAQERGTILVSSETKGADSLHQSVQAKERITLPGITSIATSLGAVQVCQTAFDYALKPNVRAVTVSDKQAVVACRRFADDERMMVEPACGAALAVVYSGLLGCLGEVKEGMKVVIVVCGGVNVSLELMDKWKKDYEL